MNDPHLTVPFEATMAERIAATAPGQVTWAIPGSDNRCAQCIFFNLVGGAIPKKSICAKAKIAFNGRTPKKFSRDAYSCPELTQRATSARLAK